MEDKTYEIKTHLVEEFKQFQISRQKAAMAFVGNCTLLINAMAMRTSVLVALNGVISIDPFPLFQGGLMGFEIPPQRLDVTGYNTVIITLHPALKIHLIFDSADQKMQSIDKLNLFTLYWLFCSCRAGESPSSVESASAPSSSSASSAPTIDSGFENVQ